MILITNDDGINAPGIKKLEEYLSKIDETFTVAPDSEKSAISHALSLHKPIRIKQIVSNKYAVEGTPADCIFMALKYILDKKPDFIVSGINSSANVGNDIIYSGTVAGAREGAFNGIPSLAISMAVLSGESDYNISADFASYFIENLKSFKFPANTYLNVNVPLIKGKAKPSSYAFTKPGFRDYGAEVIERCDPRGNKYFWIGGDPTHFKDIPGSDCNAIVNNIISITPLNSNPFYSDDDCWNNLNIKSGYNRMSLENV